MKKLDRTAIVLLILAAGFLTTAIEVRWLHRDVLREEWQAWIPVVYSVAAAVVSVLAAVRLASFRMVACVGFALGIAAGLFGVFRHTEGKPMAIMQMLTAEVIVAKADDGDEGGEEGNRGRREGGEAGGEPPALAPLGIAGLAAIGLVLVWPERRKPATA